MSTQRPSLPRRVVSWLLSPSNRWKAGSLLLAGFVAGVALVVGTNEVVRLTGTNEFCGGACHSHAKFVYPEFKQSVHFSNAAGLQASCSDCHLPHNFFAKLLYKARAGVTDVYAEMRGTISTKEKFEAARWRMANKVWDEMRANNSAACRSCHDPVRMVAAQKDEGIRELHQEVVDGKSQCIDCHVGVAHVAPTKPRDGK